jgi:type VI secretion system protein ImpL
MPRPFDQLLAEAATQFEHDVSVTKAGQLMIMLRDQIYPVCQRTITDRYPFVKASKDDVPLADFAKLFSPNGLMDHFFTQNLAPYADTSKPQWTWRQSSGVDPALSPTTLREFQRAADIRDAFFQTGGNAPVVSLAVKAPPLAAAGVSVHFDIGGASVVSSAPLPGAAAQAAAEPPIAVQWPGASSRTAIIVTSDQGVAPSVLERSGPWSLFRMLEAGSLAVKAENATASFVVGGQELRYRITSGSLRNPLNLASLREFHCPGGI